MWFSGKTLYQYKNLQNVDEGSLFEERVVIVKADNFEEAEAKIEVEARKYSSSKWLNSRGEKSFREYLEVYDIFSIGDSLDDGLEVFSMTTPFDEKVDDREFEGMRLGYMVDEERRKEILERFKPVDSD